MCLSCVIYSCTNMTDGARQPEPQSRASQSRAAAIAANRPFARRSRADGTRLFDLATPGLSLPGRSQSLNRTGSGRRREGRLHRQVIARAGGTGPFLCQDQTPITERFGQPRPACLAATEVTRWRSVARLEATRSNWNTASTACSPSNSNEFTNCWCPTSAGPWDFRRPVSSRMWRR